MVDTPPCVDYGSHIAELVASGTFTAWLSGLRDKSGQGRIADRLERLAAGNPGDHNSVGGGIVELRMTFGPGHRVYYTHRGALVIVLLAGGDKATQAADIARARIIAAELE